MCACILFGPLVGSAWQAMAPSWPLQPCGLLLDILYMVLKQTSLPVVRPVELPNWRETVDAGRYALLLEANSRLKQRH